MRANEISSPGVEAVAWGELGRFWGVFSVQIWWASAGACQCLWTLSQSVDVRQPWWIRTMGKGTTLDLPACLNSIYAVMAEEFSVAYFYYVSGPGRNTDKKWGWKIDLTKFWIATGPSMNRFGLAMFLRFGLLSVRNPQFSIQTCHFSLSNRLRNSPTKPLISIAKWNQGLKALVTTLDWRMSKTSTGFRKGEEWNAETV